MFTPTRRRALGLLIAASAGLRLGTKSASAIAQDEALLEDEAEEEEDNECFDTKTFGAWTGQATDQQAGASLKEMPATNADACDLTMEFEVNTDFDARIFVVGSPEGTPLPEEFLVKPTNRLLAKDASGAVVVDEPLCGNCTDIYDDALSIVLPLATAPLLREQSEVEIALRLEGKAEDCRFRIDCSEMRQVLSWAAQRRDELAKERDDGTCTSADCFITTACCDVVGLADDCFELRALRRYRDQVLAKQRGGDRVITQYYRLAPRILANLGKATRDRNRTLLSAYARFVLPAALAARLGMDRLAYSLYTRMLRKLAKHARSSRRETAAPHLPPS